MTTTPLTDAINALTTYANETTGASDTDLSSAVATLVAGYGGGGGYTADEIAQGYPSGSVVLNDSITSIGAYAMAGRTQMTSFSSNATSVGSYALAQCTSLVSANLPNLTKINGYLFNNCTSLTSINIPNADRIDGARPFNSCTNLLTINLPKVATKKNAGDNIFTGSSATTIVLPAFTSWSFNGFVNAPVRTLDLGLNVTSLVSNVFASATAMNVLIIRKTSGVPSLAAVNGFSNTPFASDKAGGTLYVPQSLISSYESASNWSTIRGYENNSIQAIEGSQYEDYYADGTPIE